MKREAIMYGPPGNIQRVIAFGIVVLIGCNDPTSSVEQYTRLLVTGSIHDIDSMDPASSALVKYWTLEVHGADTSGGPFFVDSTLSDSAGEFSITWQSIGAFSGTIYLTCEVSHPGYVPFDSTIVSPMQQLKDNYAVLAIRIRKQP